MQKAMIIGNLGKDAEVKEVNGSQFVSFTIADTNKRKTAAGEIVESTTWYDCTMNKTNVFPYLKKGQQVMIIGRIYANAYISKQDEHLGEAMAKMKFAVQELQLLGGVKNDNQQPAPAQQPVAQYPYAQQAVQQPQAQQATMEMPPDGDDDLPF
jgi:single-strand DNA-binding protein